MGVRPTQSREGVKGGISPCGVKGRSSLVGFGATPQLFHGRPTPSKPPNKGAGSEASLPLTSRSRRSAPKLLYPLLAHCRAKWARPRCMISDHSWSFPQAGDFASAEATRGQWKQTKSAVAPPLTPSVLPLFGFIFGLSLIVLGKFALS